MKRIRRFFAAMIFLLLGCLQGNAAVHGLAAASSHPMRSLSAEEIVAEMGTGWNLGNTMDGHTGFTPGETIWQSVVTTKELITAIHDMGFNTVRVPVTWGTMIDDENDYQIDEKWMSRVQDIVDYAVSQDMYVIINIHHDGAEQTGWLRVASDEVDYVNEKFAAVWKQIAETFRDYDEHVIFESMNEVKGDDDTTAGILRDYERINELNQIFVDTVRATGGNNAERWLSVPGRYTNIDSTTNESYGFTLPEDSAEGRLFVSIHYYDYSFGLVETTGKTTFSYENAEDLAKDIEKLYESFTSQGIPVIMGEYGCINKDNASERAYHLEVVNRLCEQNGIVPVYWDQGWYDRSESPDYSFALIDRDTLEIIDKEVTDAIFRGYYVEGEADLSDIEKSPEIIEISSITSDTHGVSLEIGEEKTFLVRTVPENTNDVVLWTTSDAAVATVSAGHVIARGIGQAQITAYAQSGGAEYTFFVTVTADEDDAGIVTIRTDEILRCLSTQEELPDSDETDAESDLSGLSDDGEALDDANAGEISLEVGEYFFLADFVSQSLENEETADSEMDTSDTASGTEESMDVNTEASSEYVCYCSDDESVVTVSTIGKVLAVGTGTASITVTASSGSKVSICVSAEEAAVEKVLTLALNVYYNDDALGYYSNEYGSAISVEEDGQYILVFDCAEDLSGAAVSAGVAGLNNLTAIYIKDHAVTLGEASVTPVVSCDIFFDAVVVDGTPLTITQTESKSALKSSGILDTNDPLNSWDGSLVEEVTVDNHVLNIVGIDNPQRIEVTFTISNLVFED
ncbi:MAG: cellulase family glycosylhydrolase [Lachnospiraceae bacterium]|nr:cellulase family glycosylhydrolase [Lachnospiraceae bacterium]